MSAAMDEYYRTFGRWLDDFTRTVTAHRTRTVTCPECNGHGRIDCRLGNDPRPAKWRECEECMGSGEVGREIEE